MSMSVSMYYICYGLNTIVRIRYISTRVHVCAHIHIHDVRMRQ